MNYSALLISLQVAMIATAISFVLGIFIAWFVSKLKIGKAFFDGVFSLPLVLPPTIIGFYLLMAFGEDSPVGKFLVENGFDVVSNINGAIISALVVSFPFMYRGARSAFDKFDYKYIQAARTLGMSEWKILDKVIIPITYPGILAGTILAFSRAICDFGATVILAGNVPDKTQTISTAVYSAVQSGDNELAYKWAVVMTIIAVVFLIIMSLFEYLASRKKGGRK